MSLDPLHSSQDFVRALKAAADPPVAGGPPKIDVALKAWNDSSFYVPSKGEIIADWLLTKLLKEKGKEHSANPIFDIRYWQLLASVTEAQGTAPKGVDVRVSKSWLATLLHRVPLAPIVVAFLSSFDTVSANVDLVSAITSCLAGLWPLSVQRMTVELLQSCFGAFLCCTLRDDLHPGMVQLGKTISGSYRDSLTNSTQKKKLCQSFLQTHLSDWLQCIEASQTGLPPALKSSILDAGVETLFNLDILRQSHDTKADVALLEHLQLLSSSKRALVLRSCPQMLAHYIRAVKRHRGALFSQGSQLGASLDEVHQSAVNFFVSLVDLIGTKNIDEETWRARVGLLEVVKNENIFNRRQEAGMATFNQILDVAVQSLQDSWKEELLARTDLTVQCISTISEIDYDIVQPVLPKIMPLLIQVPAQDGLKFTLLDIILDYHTKTRTMDALIQAFFAAISAPKSIPGNAQKTYQICSSSPVMHTAYLQRIGRALHTFMTESQSLPVVDATSIILRDMWQKIYTMLQQLDGADENPKKKRRTSTAPVVDDASSAQELAVVYSLTCRFASVLLSSLPMASLSDSTQEGAKLLLQNFRADFVRHATGKSLKLLKKSSPPNTWPLEITLAANLRLLYALDVSKNLTLPSEFDAKICSKMASLANEAALPELTMEMFRVLLYSISIDKNDHTEAIISNVLQYVEANLDRSDDTCWLGQGFELTEGESGKAKGALALLHMMVERWLPLLDHFGSQEQLKALIQILVSIKLPVGLSSSGGVRAGGLLVQVLRAAEFWELPNTRTVFLALLDNSTASLDAAKGKLPKTSKVLEHVAVYRLLLFFPMEYLSWQLLNDLIKRALEADVALSDSSSSSRKEAVREAIVTLRIFLKRAYVYSGSVAQDSHDELSKFLIHLLDKSAALDTTSNDNFTKATLDLVEIYFTKLLKVSKKNGPQPVLDVLSIYDSNLFTNAPAASSWSFITLVNLLTKEFPADSLPQEITSALAALYKSIATPLLPLVKKIATSDTFEQDIRANHDLASGWHSLLCLQNWLVGKKTSEVSLVGQALTAKLMMFMASGRSGLADEFSDLCTTAFAILIRELDIRPEAERSTQLDLIVASYISLRARLDPSHRDSLGLYLGRACRKFAPDDYGYMLSLMIDSLSDVAHIPSDQLVHLVQLSGLLLREHPSHSLQHIQKFTTAAFNIFTEQDIFVNGPVLLRQEVLDVVAQHCSEQPAALRSLDVAAIWLLLSKFLAPSQEHDPETTSSVLHKIVAILSALIRLRRDLITHGLPHLGIILRRLLLCMRGCRGQLGARQTDLVMHTQPRWINAAQPMAIEEAKVLGRLLESLNTKTIIRAYTSSSTSSLTATTEAQKAESLAKPFSKHAAYVLKAYIEAMNDPLCVMPLEVRKELQPGIFALCEMVSEHSRDSLMISALDAGGKALLKSLWKDYDKQRYVGKG